VKVPAASVGGVSAGKTVYSVGAYAMIGRTELGVGVLQNLPITVDSTPTFDTALTALPAGAPGGGKTTLVPPAPGVGKVPASAGASSAAGAAAPVVPPSRTAAPPTADSTSFVKVAAVSGTGLVLLLLVALGVLRRSHRAHH
jgi:hypothetical protein